MTWKPILRSKDAETARRHVLRIAGDLKTLLPSNPGGPTEWLRPDALGEVGVFFDYAARSLGDEDFNVLAETFIDYAVASLERSEVSPALFGGYCGVAWAAEYVERSAPDREAGTGDDDDPNSEVDAALIELLGEIPWEADYDLIGGLVGYAVYFSGRLHRKTARQGMGLVLKRLDETKTQLETGLTWHTSPDLLPRWQREIFPNGHFNVGLAHGVPGVLAVLAIAEAHGVEPALASQLFDGSVAWLESIRQDSTVVGSNFPSWWMPGQHPMASRQAWCYGDPGVATACLGAAILLDDDRLADTAVEILRYCAAIPLEIAGVRDAGLCHGAGGLAHLYNRAYQATGLPDLRDAAVSWLRHSLHYAGDKGYGGYQSFRGSRDPLSGSDRHAWEDSASLLTGSAGIGMAYLASISDVAPDWDRRILLALPSPRG